VIGDHDYQKYPELTNSELSEFGFMSPHEQITMDFDAFVVRVHDGDTITLRVGWRDFDFPLRFLDIDAPELSTGDTKSRDYVKSMIEGQTVRILVDGSNRVDKYGRLLGKVLFNGILVGDDMMYLGLAVPFGSIFEGQALSINKTVPVVDTWV
jgi:endonuclease YncB( thermonuclease family)